jgi:hypothetical protein
VSPTGIDLPAWRSLARDLVADDVHDAHDGHAPAIPIPGGGA